MSALLRKISGKECVKILCNKFGFYVSRQKGSHIVLAKQSAGEKIVTVVQNHKELRIGTLKEVLKLARIDEEEFAKFQYGFPVPF